jgi:hypothetical protein
MVDSASHLVTDAYGVEPRRPVRAGTRLAVCASMARVSSARRQAQSRQPPVSKTDRCIRKFLRIFPAGFTDPTYLAWERDYKWRAHQQWEAELSVDRLHELLAADRAREAAAIAVRIESRTNLLFSFEKMALRDAVRSAAGARQFIQGLLALLHTDLPLSERFERWKACIQQLPKRQSRVLTWPLLTVFGFIAQPRLHMFLKPTVTRTAAEKLGLDFAYGPPSAAVYANLLHLAQAVRALVHDLKPRDMIDIQSFIWVQGSDEY